MWQEMSAERARRVVAEARRSPWFAPGCAIPEWYLHRWHFLPEGYLSRRSVAAYDAVIRRIYYAGLERRAHGAILAVLAERRPATLLEAGCGPGRLLEAAARRLPGTRLTGIDLSPFMVERAAARLGDRATLLHGDIGAVATDRAPFEVVTACHVLGHMPRDVADETAARLLGAVAPGGLVVLVEHGWHPLPAPLRELAPSSRWIVPGRVRLLVVTRPAD